MTADIEHSKHWVNRQEQKTRADQLGDCLGVGKMSPGSYVLKIKESGDYEIWRIDSGVIDCSKVNHA